MKWLALSAGFAMRWILIVVAFRPFDNVKPERFTKNGRFLKLRARKHGIGAVPLTRKGLYLDPPDDRPSAVAGLDVVAGVIVRHFLRNSTARSLVFQHVTDAGYIDC